MMDKKYASQIDKNICAIVDKQSYFKIFNSININKTPGGFEPKIVVNDNDILTAELQQYTTKLIDKTKYSNRHLNCDAES